MEPRHILAEHSPRIRALARRVCAIVRRTIPDAAEVAYPIWHAIGYRHPEAGYFCGIFPYDDHVKVYFEHGVRLSDPSYLLEGDGRQTRFVRIADAKEIQVGPIKRLLVQAVAIRNHYRGIRAKNGRPSGRKAQVLVNNVARTGKTRRAGRKATPIKLS